jgi:hypothetical protein
VSVTYDVKEPVNLLVFLSRKSSGLDTYGDAINVVKDLHTQSETHNP